MRITNIIVMLLVILTACDYSGPDVKKGKATLRSEFSIQNSNCKLYYIQASEYTDITAKIIICDPPLKGATIINQD